MHIRLDLIAIQNSSSEISPRGSVPKSIGRNSEKILRETILDRSHSLPTKRSERLELTISDASLSSRITPPVNMK